MYVCAGLLDHGSLAFMAPVIFRYEVPIDDQWHEVELMGKIMPTVGARHPFKVEFWALSDSDPGTVSEYAVKRSFRVYGTGHPLPEGIRPEQLHGNVIAGGGMYVWHLVERR